MCIGFMPSPCDCSSGCACILFSKSVFGCYTVELLMYTTLDANVRTVWPSYLYPSGLYISVLEWYIERPGKNKLYPLLYRGMT